MWEETLPHVSKNERKMVERVWTELCWDCVFFIITFSLKLIFIKVRHIYYKSLGKQTVEADENDIFIVNISYSEIQTGQFICLQCALNVLD